MIPCICVDDSNRPEEIPTSLWVVKNREYNITHVWMHHLQGLQGCSLKELRLTKECYPYETYKLSRFGMTVENLQKLIQMMKDCSELDDVNIKKLIRESELEIIEK